CNTLKSLDSGLRRNDGSDGFWTFYELINVHRVLGLCLMSLKPADSGPPALRQRHCGSPPLKWGEFFRTFHA
ncbi:MAG: hypothetical protein ABIJ95_00635, partial [Pseudomonadota bacterium]